MVLTCLCGCRKALPAGHQYFATNECIERWQRRYGAFGSESQRLTPDAD